MHKGVENNGTERMTHAGEVKLAPGSAIGCNTSFMSSGEYVKSGDRPLMTPLFADGQPLKRVFDIRRSAR